MSKPSDRKRKKKADRERRLRAEGIREAERGRFPRIVIDPTGAAEDLVALVRDVVRNLRFNDTSRFSSSMVGMFKAQASLGWADAAAAATPPPGQTRDMFVFEAAMAPGRAIFDMIGQDKLLAHIPYGCVDVTPVYREWRVTFRSLNRTPSPTGTIYSSPKSPKVLVDGVERTVGWSRHAIEQTCDRLVPTWRTYTGLGDAFAFFNTCTYFEPCTLPSGQPAFTFFEECVPGFFTHAYVKEVLGVDGPAPGYCFRVGYCPADVREDFFVARTFLPPGFTKTPEHALLSRTPLGQDERRHLHGLAVNNERENLVGTHDFTAIKLFHDSGIPQVRRFDHPIHDRSETISKALTADRGGARPR